MPIQLFPGDKVRLTTTALAIYTITLDRIHHDTAHVVETTDCLDVLVCILDRPMGGEVVWNAKDLVRIKKGKTPKQEEVPLKLYRGFMPSNFTPAQMNALRAFEQADEANQGPAKTHTLRRTLRRELFIAHRNVEAAGVDDALCAAELSRLTLAYIAEEKFHPTLNP